jgi:ribosomal protein S18 acetylase RimI-like enzyme
MIEIREARPEDLEAIALLLDQLKEVTALHGPVERATVKNSYKTMLHSPEFYRSYLAVEGQRIVGLVSLVLYKTLLHAGGTALINELVVSEAARGRGVGRRLVQKAMAVAREQGMDEIEVGTETDNVIARRFYRPVGFDQEYVLRGREL